MISLATKLLRILICRITKSPEVSSSLRLISDSGSGLVGWIVIVISSGLRVEMSCVVLVTALRDQRS
jgi:hypothetical protein